MIETYLEECTDQRGPNHLDLVKRLVMSRGMTEEQVAAIRPSVGNAAAMALYKDIGSRGFSCHMLGAGAVEFYYCQLCPKIFAQYTKHYGFTEQAAETYKIHGPMDQVHADRALSKIDEALELHSWEEIERSVRDAFVATSLHYDGMLEAAVGYLSFWNGVS
jgi:pyrroloquinoline quinone (PQQ) biosynthesis protein C